MLQKRLETLDIL